MFVQPFVTDLLLWSSVMSHDDHPIRSHMPPRCDREVGVKVRVTELGDMSYRQTSQDCLSPKMG